MSCLFRLRAEGDRDVPSRFLQYKRARIYVYTEVYIYSKLYIHCSMYISIAEQTKIVIPFALKARFKRHSWFLLHHPRRSRAPLYVAAGRRGVRRPRGLLDFLLAGHHSPHPPHTRTATISTPVDVYYCS